MNHYTICVPYRDRAEHLETLLRRLPAWLERQDYIDSYFILLVEQADGLPFNLGWIINVGFALTDCEKRDDIGFELPDSEDDDVVRDFFMFHPVDCYPLLPDERQQGTPELKGGGISGEKILADLPPNTKEVIRASSYRIDRGDIVLLAPRWWKDNAWSHFSTYYKAFITDREIYRRVNGHSNRYVFGWGLDDDDFLLRLKFRGVDSIHRPFVWHEVHGEPSRHARLSNTSIWEQTLAMPDPTVEGLSTLDVELADVKPLPVPGAHVFVKWREETDGRSEADPGTRRMDLAASGVRDHEEGGLGHVPLDDQGSPVPDPGGRPTEAVRLSRPPV